MYLISAYFDKTTNKALQKYIDNVAQATGNDFMLSHNVPPHLTLSAIEAKSVEVLLPSFEALSGQILRGKISIITVGQLMPQVLYVAPYLNEYLQEIELQIYNNFYAIPKTSISNYYKPLSWLPHITIAKTLSKEQMIEAFKVMQDFKPINAEIVRIGLAKVNPHQDVAEIIFFRKINT